MCRIYCFFGSHIYYKLTLPSHVYLTTCWRLHPWPASAAAASTSIAVENEHRQLTYRWTRPWSWLKTLVWPDGTQRHTFLKPPSQPIAGQSYPLYNGVYIRGDGRSASPTKLTIWMWKKWNAELVHFERSAYLFVSRYFEHSIDFIFVFLFFL